MSPPPIHFFHALFATLFIVSINSFLLRRAFAEGPHPNRKEQTGAAIHRKGSVRILRTGAAHGAADAHQLSGAKDRSL